MEGYELVSAQFANDAKNSVVSYWRPENWDEYDGELKVDFCKAEEGDETWEHILTKFSIDDIHEQTAVNIRNQTEVYKQAVIDIAKEEGLIYNSGMGQEDTSKLLYDTLFNFDDKKKELLFQFKLQIFERPEVKGADAQIKQEIRKADDILKVIAAVLKIS